MPETAQSMSCDSHGDCQRVYMRNAAAEFSIFLSIPLALPSACSWLDE